MVVAAFPLAKIGLLLMKQLSKPLATMIKNRAKKHPLIRRSVIIPTGRAYKWVEDQFNYVKGQKVERLSEEETVELGANAIGEIILFGILSLILLAEMNRQDNKKAGLQRMKDDELTNVKDIIIELVSDVARLQKTVVSLEKNLKTATDMFEMEGSGETTDNDFDFLDTFSKKSRAFGKNKVDKSSPSW